MTPLPDATLSATDASPDRSRLPRLLYVADLEVYPSYAGALQMFRLLENYPADRLMLVYPGATARQAIPGARHAEIRAPWWLRLLPARGHRHLLGFGTWLQWTFARRTPADLGHDLRVFAPEGVLTVALGGAWVVADNIAREFHIPLHLFVHDDRAYLARYAPWHHRWIERKFAQVYRRAASRVLVTEPMDRAHRQRHGAGGTVILPTRGRDRDRLPPPPASAGPSRGRVVYAGSVWGPPAWDFLDRLGRELRRLGGSLTVFATNPPGSGAGATPGYTLRPPLPANAVAATLRAEADILLQFASFDPVDATAAATLFPTKLVDYAAAGRPIFLSAPDYSSTAWLARTYPEAFAFLASNDPGVVAAAIHALVLDAGRAQELGLRARKLGEALFASSAGFAQLCRLLAPSP